LIGLVFAVIEIEIIKFRPMTFQQIIHSDKPVLVDFHATWCGPCKAMAPILADLKQQIGDQASIIKVDVDKNTQAAAAYQVSSVPTLILFKAGKVLWRQSGVASVGSLKELIQKYG